MVTQIQAGDWNQGGFDGCGLTGRKLVVDNYVSSTNWWWFIVERPK